MWIAAAIAAVYFLFSNHFLSPPDCASYWAWADSLLHGFNFDFQSAYARLDMPTLYCYITPAGRLSNDWPMGTGLLLLPVAWAGTAVAHAFVLLCFVGALAWWYRGRPESSRIRITALAAAFTGTPLLFYALYGPFFSHVPSFVATTLFLGFWDRTRTHRSLQKWFILGVLLGLSGLVRPQNLFLGVVLLVEIPALAARRPVRGVLLFVLGVVLAFASQFIIYWRIYGSVFALPKIDEMLWFRPAIGPVLLSDFHGVLPWTPLYVLVVPGLVLLARRDRQLATGLACCLFVQLYLNAANYVWWSGGSFGNRRLADSSIIVAYAICGLLGNTVGAKLRRVDLAAIVVCCAWTMLLVFAERRGILPLDRYVPFFTRDFWGGLSRTLLHPIETIVSLLRPMTGDQNLLGRIIASLLLFAGSCGVLALARRRGVPAPRRTGVTIAIALPLLLVIITAIAAARTPVVKDKQLVRQLGTQSRMLWDNHIELAYYYLVRGQPALAAQSAQKAIQLRPDHYSGWWYYAMALYDAKLYAQAAEAFGRVAALDPDHPRAAAMQVDSAQRALQY
jgi:hypothetical protein